MEKSFGLLVSLMAAFMLVAFKTSGLLGFRVQGLRVLGLGSEGLV